MEIPDGGNEVISTSVIDIDIKKIYLTNLKLQNNLLSKVGQPIRYKKNAYDKEAIQFKSVQNIDLQKEIFARFKKLSQLISEYPGNKDYIKSYNDLCNNIRDNEFSSPWLYNNSCLKLMVNLKSIDETITTGKELLSIFASDRDTIATQIKIHILCLYNEMSLDCFDDTSAYKNYVDNKADKLLKFYDRNEITELLKAAGNGLVSPGLEKGLKMSPYGKIVKAILNELPKGFFTDNKIGNLIIKGSEKMNYDSVESFMTELVKKSLDFGGVLEILAKNTGDIIKKINIGDIRKLFI